MESLVPEAQELGFRQHGANQVGMFGRFKNMFGRVKDEALKVGKSEPQIIIENQVDANSQGE